MKPSELRKMYDSADISKLERQYGTVYFRMGLYHLFDVGCRHMTDEVVDETKKEIMATEPTGSPQGISILSPEFQCKIIDIAQALSRFPITNLLAYIKTDLKIG